MRLVWPPTTGTSKRAAAACRPASTGSARAAPRHKRLFTSASGRPPIAAMSLRFTSTPHQPANQGSLASRPGSIHPLAGQQQAAAAGRQQGGVITEQGGRAEGGEGLVREVGGRALDGGLAVQAGQGTQLRRQWRQVDAAHATGRRSRDGV